MVKVLTIKGSCAPFLEDKEEVSALKSNIPQPLPRIYFYLFFRPIARVRSQYHLNREEMCFLGEEREQLSLVSMWYPELEEYTWEAGPSGDEGEEEVQGWLKGNL